MSLTVDALIVLASLIASAFFSGAETALTAASRARMHALEMDGNPSASLVNRLILARGRLIGAMLLGGQVVNIAASSFATSVLLVIAVLPMIRLWRNDPDRTPDPPGLEAGGDDEAAPEGQERGFAPVSGEAEV